MKIDDIEIRTSMDDQMTIFDFIGDENGNKCDMPNNESCRNFDVGIQKEILG